MERKSIQYKPKSWWAISHARSVPRRLSTSSNRISCWKLHGTVQAIQNRSHPLLRLLAAGESAPYRAAINEKLRAAAATCAKSNLILLLENEMACNTARARSGRRPQSRPQQELHAQWDPGNAAALNSTPYPDGTACYLSTHRSLPRKKMFAACREKV